MPRLRSFFSPANFRAAGARLKWAMHSPTPSTRPIRDHIQGLLDWILKAQRATPDDGVSQSYHIQWGKWQPSYPETTGYIICSMIRAANAGFGNRDELRESARRMGEWLADVQLSDGAFQGGPVGQKNPKPAIFNTGQILKGLGDLIREGLDSTGRLRKSADRAAAWMVEMQDADGGWRRGLSVLANSPIRAYNIRAAWGLARYGQIVGENAFVQAGILNGDWLLSVQSADGWFEHMNFDLGVDPLLHTVAYTINGLMELGVLSGRKDFIQACRIPAGLVAELQNPSTGGVPGQIARGYRAAVDWYNTTATAQMAIIWFRLAELTGEKSWVSYAKLANDFNRSLHELDSPDERIRGGLIGCWPVHAGYGKYWYMNWTQKFFLDSLLAEAGISIV